MIASSEVGPIRLYTGQSWVAWWRPATLVLDFRLLEIDEKTDAVNQLFASLLRAVSYCSRILCMPRGNPSPKLAITIDPDVHENVLAAAARGGGGVSAWVTAAARPALPRGTEEHTAE